MDDKIVAIIVQEGGKFMGELVRLHMSRPKVVQFSPPAIASALSTAKPERVPTIVVEAPPERPRAHIITCPTCQREPTQKKGTACLPCTRDHLATVSGALGEGLRFARDGGIDHPEAQRRLALAEEELVMAERVDLAADNLAQLSPKERQLADAALVRMRELRQAMGGIKTFEEMEEVAGEAAQFRQEFRLALIALTRDIRPLMAIAKDLEDGKITKEEARAKVEAFLPAEEKGEGQ